MLSEQLRARSARPFIIMISGTPSEVDQLAADKLIKNMSGPHSSGGAGRECHHSLKPAECSDNPRVRL